MTMQTQVSGYFDQAAATWDDQPLRVSLIALGIGALSARRTSVWQIHELGGSPGGEFPGLVDLAPAIEKAVSVRFDPSSHHHRISAIYLAEVADGHLCSHSCDAASEQGMNEGAVEQSRDHPAVHTVRIAEKSRGWFPIRMSDSIRRDFEVQVQSGCIANTACETVTVQFFQLMSWPFNSSESLVPSQIQNCVAPPKCSEYRSPARGTATLTTRAG